jgi:hypothetical protein
VRRLIVEDPNVAVWWGTPVEIAAAIARRRREGVLPAAHHREAARRLGQMARAWTTVAASLPVRARALRLVEVHPLRAADALQLAAALVWADESPAGRELVTLDERLGEAARREGFMVRPEAA